MTVVVDFDPTRDLTYRRAKLARDVADWLAWLELGNYAPRTLDQYERDLARVCLMFPKLSVEEFSDSELLHVAKRFKPAERRVRMAAVKKFFWWAHRVARRINENPCDYLPEIKRAPQKVIDVFSEAEVEALLSLDLVDAAPLAVLFEAGLRKAEARALQLRRCLPESGRVVVVAGKGGRDRIVPMTPALRSLLADLTLLEGLGPKDFVFYRVHGNEIAKHRRRDRPVGEGTFARWWRRCLDDAGVRYRNPHIARHTYATRWKERGLPLEDISANLGHSSYDTTASIYVHSGVDQIAARMEELLA